MSREKTVFYTKYLPLLNKSYVCVKYTGCIITGKMDAGKCERATPLSKEFCSYTNYRINGCWQMWKSQPFKARILLLHKSLFLTCQSVQYVQLQCFRHTILYCSCCLFKVLFHSFIQSHELCSFKSFLIMRDCSLLQGQSTMDNTQM